MVTNFISLLYVLPTGLPNNYPVQNTMANSVVYHKPITDYDTGSAVAGKWQERNDASLCLELNCGQEPMNRKE
jgi:hypothetical protein